jgi:hypothetical protein
MLDVKSLTFYFSLIFAVTLFSFPCYANGNREQQRILQSNLVFIGVSGKLSCHEDTIKAALNDAARQFSFFYSVIGHSINRDHIGVRVFDVLFSSEYQLDYDNDLDKYLEALEYDLSKDVFENNNALFVTTRVNLDIFMPVFRGHSFNRQRPRWIDNPPKEINGFITGVGFSGRLSSYRDAVVRSYERAVITCRSE